MSWWLPWPQDGWTWNSTSYFIPSLLLFSNPVLPSHFAHIFIFSLNLHLLLISVGYYYLIFQASDLSFLGLSVLFYYIIVTVLWNLNVQEANLYNFFLYNPAQKYVYIDDEEKLNDGFLMVASSISSTSHIPTFMIFHPSQLPPPSPGCPLGFL